MLNTLLDNALGHVERGGRITVSLTRDGGGVVCAVADNGSGFYPADAEGLFERFAHGDRGQGHRFGLGLALAQEVMITHGGTIAAASRPGEGATFTLRLPARDDLKPL